VGTTRMGVGGAFTGSLRSLGVRRDERCRVGLLWIGGGRAGDGQRHDPVQGVGSTLTHNSQVCTVGRVGRGLMEEGE